jgi:hypothetical protein
MVKNSTFTTGKSCGCQHGSGGLSDADTEAEKEKAKKTSEDTIKEASQYSNPNVPLPLKLTGIALIIYIITR